ncbi:MAG: CHAD domain-containing protein [Gammaproteobacteria bacterium]
MNINSPQALRSFYRPSSESPVVDPNPALPEGAKARVEFDGEVARAYLDSFDWRFWNRGEILELVEGEGRRMLELRPVGEGSPRAQQDVAAVPRMAVDLGFGAIGHMLGDVLDVRALLFARRLRSRVRRWAFRDAEGKTVLRMEWRQDRAGRSTFPVLIRFEPLRGYDKKAFQWARSLIRELGLTAVHEEPLVVATQRTRRRPGDYDGKLNVALEPDMRMDAALRTLLSSLLETMSANEAGSIGRWDIEFVHDYRVAVRRARSLLSAIKGVLPETRQRQFSDGLRRLQDVTGDPRDLDVYLLDFDHFATRLSAKDMRALEPFRGFLAERHGEAYEALRVALRSGAYTGFMDSARGYLRSPLPKSSSLPNALRPVGEVADERIWKTYRWVLKHGRAITPRSPNDDLHDVRKRCKRLRYLLEAFRGLYPPAQINGLIKALKRLQEVLGDFQDREVQYTTIHRYEDEMRSAGVLTSRTEKAMERLAEGFHHEQGEIRKDFYARFEAFASEDNARRFQGLFKS